MLPSLHPFGLARNMHVANSGSAPPTGKKKEVPELEPGHDGLYEDIRGSHSFRITGMTILVHTTGRDDSIIHCWMHILQTFQ